MIHLFGNSSDSPRLSINRDRLHTRQYGRLDPTREGRYDSDEEYEREIVVEPSADEHRMPCLPLLGVALGILLSQRGLLTFHAPLPFRALYALADGSELKAERLAPQQKFTEMMGHSYAQRFLGATGATPEHFRRCAELASVLPVFSLERPCALGEIVGY